MNVVELAVYDVHNLRFIIRYSYIMQSPFMIVLFDTTYINHLFTGRRGGNST